MLGHGCPMVTLGALMRVVALASAVALGVLVPRCAHAEEVEVRLRFAWGGSGQSTQKWTGTISVQNGQLAKLQPLGVEADECAALRLVENQVVVSPLVRRGFDGFDVNIRADETATVVVDLRDTPDASAKPLEFPLGELAVTPQRASLDALGSYVLVQPTPGHHLPVKFERDHLVFQPEEAFQLQVDPQLKLNPADGPATIEARLYRYRSNEELWQTTIAYDSNETTSIPIEFKTPQEEGAYRLKIAVIRRPVGFASRLAPWDKGAELASREVAFVVISPQQRQPRLTDQWETVSTIDSSSSSWWQRIPQWTQFDKLPAFTTPRPLGNVKPLVAATFQAGFVELPATSPGEDVAWQAYLLPVKAASEPHAVEIEVPRSLRQHLAVSIVEPDAAGRVQTFGRDLGVYGDERLGADEAGATAVDVHRIVFWPRTKSPALVIANRSHDRGALYGKIRLLRRQTAVPPAEVAPARPNTRLVAAYVSLPRFADSFGGAGEVDEATGLNIDTWHTFLTAANRLAQQLKASGYNAAILSIAADGASLAPIDGLGQSPRFDSGPLASTGSDPIRKDILEALLRVFDREGLTLVPAIKLATPLPRLEARRLASTLRRDGFEWVGADGQRWQSHFPAESATAPHYNVLNGDVQTEILSIAERLKVRYASHPAWGGLALQLQGGGFGVLPGLAWGMDDRTAMQFASQTGIALPSEGDNRFRRRAEIVLGPQLSAWKVWRQQQTTEFYAKLAHHVTSERPTARLILCTEELFSGADATERLRTAITGRATIDDVLSEVGLDLRQLASTPGLAVLRPRRLGAEDSVDARAPDLRINNSPELDQLFSHFPDSGELLYHVPAKLKLATFDGQSPFGAEQTRFAASAASQASGEAAMRGLATALTSRDFALIANGGEQFPLADSDAHRDAMRVLQELPAPHADVRSERRQPVTVRVYREAESTTICLINESPWPVGLEIPLEVDGTLVWRRLGVDPSLDDAAASRDPTISGTLPVGAKTWTTTLAPYGIQARRYSSRVVRLGAWAPKISPAARQSLDRQVAEIEQRMSGLDVERPYTELQNPHFESVGDAGQLLGWQPRIGAVGVVEAAEETAPVTGRSVHLRSEDALGVAIQSHLFPIPSTGQLAVRAMVRTKNLEPSSQLYAWVEFQSAGATRQRYVALGGNPPLASEWSECEFTIDDLPLASKGQMRLQFHLVGRGDVWIDDVRLYDLRFSKDQRYQISKRLYAAKTALEDGQLMDCQRLVEGYWPRLFVEQVPVTSLAAKPAAVPPSSASDEEAKRISDRLRGMVPRILR